MGRAAARQARGDGVSRARRAAGNGADGLVPTIREFLPWHVIEKKMAARESGRELRDEDEDEPVEAAPDSGVYTSGQHRAANEHGGGSESELEAGALTYKVYTLADLEARGFNPDMSINATRASLALMAAKQTPWLDTGRAAVVLLRVAKTWALAPSPRPAAGDVFRAPFVAFTFELRGALKQVDWRKVGVGAGLALGTFLFLLFAVVTAADLTDDLKPSRVSHTTSGDSYTNAIVAAAHPTAAPPRPVQAPPPASEDDLEISIDAPPAPAPAPVTAAKSHAGRKGKKKAAPAEVFVP